VVESRTIEAPRPSAPVERPAASVAEPPPLPSIAAAPLPSLAPPVAGKKADGLSLTLTATPIPAAPLAPSSAPAARPAGTAARAPRETVEIHIGSVEIHAAPPPTPPPARSPGPAPVSLDAFLARRPR
jgi:hypothetical protein